MFRISTILGSLAVASVQAWGFGPAAHAYIGMKILGEGAPVAAFAAVLPDMNGLFKATPGADARVKFLGHHEFERLTGSCFAASFATHNNDWGADAIAHAYFVPDAPDNYVTAKLRALNAQTGITMHEAEDLFDAALDMRLAQEVGPGLGKSLTASAKAAGKPEEDALVAAFAAPLAEGTGVTPEVAETQLRWALRCMKSGTASYGTLLQLDPFRQKLIATFFVARFFHWTNAEARTRLDVALALAGDCRPALDAMAEGIRARMLAEPGYAGCVAGR